jgi:hypothetical protein
VILVGIVRNLAEPPEERRPDRELSGAQRLAWVSLAQP